MDYPFQNWDDYYTAFTTSLCTEFYGDDYPNYAKQHDISGSKFDYKIVKEFLESGLNPQYGLDKFIKSLLEGSRYAKEIEDEIPVYIKMFFDAGAKFDFDSLFSMHYPNSTNFEDEIATYATRGMLIDIFSNYNIDVNKYYDWSSIEGVYWEYIDDAIIKNDYQKARYMALKDCSTYLKSK